MTNASKQRTAEQRASFREEWVLFCRALPGKWIFMVLLASWVVLFQWWGNSTLGYVETPSLFGWLHYVYQNSVDDQHGYLIPVVVLALMWWKRESLMAVEKRSWAPALGLVVVALALHVVGYAIQQTRLSVVAFFLGLYGLSGLVWGPGWLRATFFPMFLFAFCVPLGTLSEPLTFPLRLVATKITGWLSQGALGINVICDGTRIYDPQGAYQYEVAAACSGIRSMTATLALALIYGFVAFTSPWKRLILFLSAFPLALLSNVIRLSMIIVASEAFGHEAGHYVHESSWLSLLPYGVALGGVFLLGWWLRERWPEAEPAPVAVTQPA